MTKTEGFQSFEALKFKLSDYNVTKLEKSKLFFDEVAKFHACKAIIYHQGEAIERFEVILIHEYLNLKIEYWGYSKQYGITCENIRDLKNISNSCISSAKSKVIEPKKIGKLNKNKICEWIRFWERVYFSLCEKGAKNKKMKDDFLDTLKGLPIRWEDKEKKNNGNVKMNGIVFSFRIEETYISKRIALSNNLTDDLPTFIKLANNQLNAF